MYHEFGVVDSIMKYDLRQFFACNFFYSLVRGRGNTSKEKKRIRQTHFEWDDHTSYETGTDHTDNADNTGQHGKSDQRIHFVQHPFLTF